MPDEPALNEAEHEGEVPFRVTFISVTWILKYTYICTALHNPTSVAQQLMARGVLTCLLIAFSRAIRAACKAALQPVRCYALRDCSAA